MAGISDHPHTAVMRCLQWEEQRRRAEAALGRWTMQNFAARSRPFLRSTLGLSGWPIDRALGRVKTARSIQEYANLCDDVDLVSFDVFDTLLFRTVEPPDFLKRRCANYAANRLASYGLPVHRDLFLYVRAEEEARLRRRALAAGGDSECKLSEIIHSSLKCLGGTEAADREAEGLVEYEIDVECQHLRVAPGVRELLSALRAKGKRIIAVSDTYLETRHLELIFKRLGIERYFDAIYVSADHEIGKYRGRLFEKVVQRERIEARQMAHLGDNYESDVRAPMRRGIRSVFLRDPDRLRHRRQARRRALALAGGRFRPDSLVPLSARSGQGTNGEQAELFSIGRDVLGPAFSAFMLHAIEECYRWRVTDIYFIAREGYLLQRIHDLLVRNIHRFRKLPPIPAHYLYASRLATSLPSLGEAEKRTLHLALFRQRDAGVDDALRTFGLTVADVDELIPVSHGGRPEVIAELFANPRFQRRVENLADRARRRLKGYLAQEGFFGCASVKALIDVGWNATIQANLTRAYYRDPEFPTLIGLYFGRRYAHEDDYALSPQSHFLPGVLFDERCELDSEHAVDRCVEIFEISSSAPHGATIGYREEDGRVTPVLQDSPGRLTREQEVLQEGILTYANDFSLAYNNHEPDTKVLLRQAAVGLRRFICHPTRREAAAFKDVHHSVDWGSQSLRPLIAPNLSPLSVFTPGHLLASLRHCCWPEGSLRHSRIPGGVFLLSMIRRSLRSRRNLRRAARFCADLFRRPAPNASSSLPVFDLEARDRNP